MKHLFHANRLVPVLSGTHFLVIDELFKTNDKMNFDCSR